MSEASGSTSFEWWSLRFVLPSRWEARPDHRKLLLFPSESGDLVDGGIPCDAVAVVYRDVGDGLRAVFDDVMARRVKQGEPAVCSTSLGGRPALQATWTDGTSYVVSWFLEHRNGVYEVQCVAPLIRVGDDESRGGEAMSLCTTGTEVV